MPRLIDRRYTPLKTEVRAERAKKRRIFRLGTWIDPFPRVQGTRPEKMVFAELMKRRIPFTYQSYYRFEIPELGFDEWYRPDFVIPDAKLIIEVQGAYWHSKPDQIQKDAFRFAVFEQLGYKVLAWWDFQIESQLQQLFLQEPLLRGLQGKGGRVFTGNERIIDDSAGIRAANRARTDYGRREARYGGRSGGLYSYAVR